MRSSDGETRDLVTSRPGAGWDYSLTRHPYHVHELAQGTTLLCLQQTPDGGLFRRSIT